MKHQPTLIIKFLWIAICLCSGLSCDLRWKLEELQRPPVVKTGAVSNIRNTKVTIGGIVEWDGDAPLSERGICFGTGPSPTIASGKVAGGSAEGEYAVQVNGLLRNTTYFARAYAANEVGISYGASIEFTTTDVLDTIPSVTTAQVTNINVNSATLGGEVTSDGGNDIMVRGVCWSTEQGPDTSDMVLNSAGGAGSFSLPVKGLTENTTYFVRAYAVNDMGIAYGNQVSFQTPLMGAPLVVTLESTQVLATSAALSGNVSSEGLTSVTERGVCYSTTPGASLSNSHCISGSGVGVFSCIVDGLVEATTYYARAYATNSVSTTYGNEVMFTTFQNAQVSSLHCSSYSLNVSPIVGVPIIHAILTIPYTAGNGGAYESQTFVSTGVSGMTAVLDAGTLLQGDGSITLIVSGNPQSSGAASFNLLLAGQNCNLLIPIVAGVVSSINCSAPQVTGTFVNGFALSDGSIVISYTGGNGGAYNSISSNSTGVTGLSATIASGNFVNGNGTLIFNLSGTPNGSGNASFAISIGGQSCNIVVPIGASSVSSLNCNGAEIEGDFVAGLTLSGASLSIPYSGGNLGSYPAQNISSTGVTGLTASMPAGNFFASGNLVFSITGTPNSSGNASFAISIGGQSCTILLSVAASAVTALNCNGAVLVGDLVEGLPVSGASVTLPYSGGNLGSYSAQSINSTGVSGLTATIPAGNFFASGNLVFSITGTPNSSGNASFAISIGGQSCTILLSVAASAVTALNCNGAVLVGYLAEGLPVSGASVTLPYTGGNLGSYSAQSINSTGVTGLTASIPAGNFAASGNLVFSITGTPNSIGNAVFVVSIGGQSCTASVLVLPPNTFHTCGAQYVHNPNLTYGSMTDQQGNIYKTIVIGTQEWMAENLNTNTYRNGEVIPSANSNAWWSNTTQGMLAYYNNDENNACPYGKLYNWYACVDSRGLCPAGWHVPSDEEWSTMINYIDPSADGGYTAPNVAGIAMRSAGTIEGGDGYWDEGSVEGTNISGFSALPGGCRWIDGDYFNMGLDGYWWSSTQYDSGSAYGRRLYGPYATDSFGPANFGWSVRCLRD